MEPKFNLDRPKVSDEEINKNKDFANLVKQFKEQSIQKARNDANFLKNKKATYATVIAGIAVICTVTYFTVFNKQNKQTATNDKTNTLASTKNDKSLDNKKAFISPPSQKLNVPYSSYKVNSAKGGELAHHTRSKIKVPKNAFVNKNGQDIVGDVEIQYREFHDQADIIASGIPMQYDSAGTNYTFESAGMFDVRGYQNGEEVFIRPGKPITVELNSSQPADAYNQYYLDTVAKNWHVIKHDTPVLPKEKSAIAIHSKEVAPAKSKQEAALENKIQSIPKKVDSVKVVYTKKIETIPQPKQPSKPAKATGRPQWELDVNYKDFPELAAFKNAVFEVGAENKNYNKELQQITWSNAVITEGTQKGKNYTLTLRKRNREEKLIVYPVLSGENYEKALEVYDRKFNEYNGLVAKRDAEEQKLKAEMEAKQKVFMEEQKKLSAELLKEQIRIRREMEAQFAKEEENGATAANVKRVFTVNNFGVYNSDCARSMPNGPYIEPRYASNGVPLDPGSVMLVEHGRNIVYDMSNSAYRFMYDKNKKYTLCVVAGGNLYLCGKEEFDQVVKSGNSKFNLQQFPSENAGVADLKKALEI
jgi:hypothetical protein